jgi:hypothetical protein
MSTDWAADVRKYAPNADDKAIAGIVRYCGIALQKRDSSLMSFGDKEEVARVRSNFLKKKLGLTQPPPFIYDLRSTNDLGCRLNFDEPEARLGHTIMRLMRPCRANNIRPIDRRHWT